MNLCDMIVHLYALVIVLCVANGFAFAESIVSVKNARLLASRDSNGCFSPFGSPIGSDPTGVVAYSNCNDTYVSQEDSYVNGLNGPVYAGLQWQCVEYSRRWLISNLHVSFDSVDIAAQIWALPTVNVLPSRQAVHNYGAEHMAAQPLQQLNAAHEVSHQSDATSAINAVITSAQEVAATLAQPQATAQLPFDAFANGESVVAPSVGCLLIYNTQLAPTGHVAVITEVDAAGGSVSVSEQNWSNDHWPTGAKYSRKLGLVQAAESGAFFIKDDFLIGWKCVHH